MHFASAPPLEDPDRLIAVGDVHGMQDKLEDLIDTIDPQPDDQFVFLGDYIDRGPQSFEVVEFLLELHQEFPHWVYLRGNHEDFVIAMLQGNQNPMDRELWLNYNGGRETVLSYRRNQSYLKDHQQFYLRLPLFYETEEHFFCHAGVRPGCSLERQRPVDLLEIRDPFLSSDEDFGKVVVHGHSGYSNPVTNRAEVVSNPNRMGLDTGAAWGGVLSAMDVLTRHLWQI